MYLNLISKFIIRDLAFKRYLKLLFKFREIDHTAEYIGWASAIASRGKNNFISVFKSIPERTQTHGTRLSFGVTLKAFNQTINFYELVRKFWQCYRRS